MPHNSHVEVIADPPKLRVGLLRKMLSLKGLTDPVKGPSFSSLRSASVKWVECQEDLFSSPCPSKPCPTTLALLSPSV